MKILFAVHAENTPNAGSPGVTIRLGETMKEIGHEVDYFFLDNMGAFGFRSKQYLWFTFPFTLAKYIIKAGNKYDVVDVSAGNGWFYALLNRFLKGETKVVFRSHGLDHLAHKNYLKELKSKGLKSSFKYKLYSKFWLWETKMSMLLADCCLLLNSFELEYSAKNLRIPRTKLKLMANPIPLYHFNSNSNSKTVSIGKLKTIFVGTMEERKGLIPLCNAIIKLRKDGLNITLTIVGIPGKSNDLKEIIGTLDGIDVKESIKNTDLPLLYREHNVFVLASSFEGFQLSTAEAMANGLAVISSKAGLGQDWITNFHNGILVNPTDSGEIYDALKSLYNNREIIKKLSENAYLTSKEFDSIVVSKKTLEVYKGC